MRWNTDAGLHCSGTPFTVPYMVFVWLWIVFAPLSFGLGSVSACANSLPASTSEHSSTSSLVEPLSSDTNEMQSDWSVVSEGAWLLQGVSGRFCNWVWRDSMIWSLCWSSLLNLLKTWRPWTWSPVINKVKWSNAYHIPEQTLTSALAARDPFYHLAALNDHLTTKDSM